MVHKKIKAYTLVVVLLCLLISSLVMFQRFTEKKIYDYINYVVGASIKTQINHFKQGLDDDYSVLLVLRDNLENNMYKSNEDIVNSFSAVVDSKISSVKTVAMVDLQGNTLNNSGGCDNIKNKWYFKSVLTKERFFAKSKDVNGNDFFLVSTPFYIDGKVGGAIIGYYSEALYKLFSANAFDVYKTLICDGDGNILLSSGENETVKSLFDYPGAGKVNIDKTDVINALNTDEIYIRKVTDNKGYFYAVGKPIGINEWYVVEIFENDKIEYSTHEIISASYLEMAISVCFIIAIMCVWFFTDRHRFKLEETYRRNTLQSQLNPHFMFNSLSALCSLINYEPDTAVKMTYDFSKYMRSNLMIINNDGCIPFKKELEHITSFCDI